MVRRVTGFIVLLILSWTVMTFTHEMGHIIGGCCCGGILRAADLMPWRLPYSLFDPDPRPLVTLWCGPILGVILPVGIAMGVRKAWMWFIAWFCVLANGMYIAVAWFSGDPFLDTPRMIEQGAHPAAIVIYCILTIGAGYWGFRKACIRALSEPVNSVGKS